MDKNRVEELIPKAMESVEKFIIKNNSVASEFKGYISTFGAGIVQNGLLSTLAFYENKSANTNEDRSSLLKAIFYLIDKKSMEEFEESLLKYVLEKDDRDYIKEEIVNAAIAIKLALRTFPVKK